MDSCSGYICGCSWCIVGVGDCDCDGFIDRSCIGGVVVVCCYYFIGKLDYFVCGKKIEVLVGGVILVVLIYIEVVD